MNTLGWYLNLGAVPVEGAPRNCVKWNDKERHDLLDAYVYSEATVITLQHRHQRTLGGIKSELNSLLFRSGLPKLLKQLDPNHLSTHL